MMNERHYAPFDPSNGPILSDRLVGNYFSNLVDLFFKILPLWEDREETLPLYMETLLNELVGCEDLLEAADNDAAFMSLLSTLQYLIKNPDLPTDKVKRHVFKAISICNKLAKRYRDRCEGGGAK